AGSCAWPIRRRSSRAAAALARSRLANPFFNGRGNTEVGITRLGRRSLNLGRLAPSRLTRSPLAGTPDMLLQIGKLWLGRRLRPLLPRFSRSGLAHQEGRLPARTFSGKTRRQLLQ